MERDPITTEEASGVQPPRSGEIDARMPAFPRARVISSLIAAFFRHAGSPDYAGGTAEGAMDVSPRDRCSRLPASARSIAGFQFGN